MCSKGGNHSEFNCCHNCESMTKRDSTPNPIFPLSWNQSHSSMTTLVWVCAIVTPTDERTCRDGIIDGSPFWNFPTTPASTVYVSSPFQCSRMYKGSLGPCRFGAYEFVSHTIPTPFTQHAAVDVQ